MKKKEETSCPSRLGKVGGEAVMEGVMMRCADNYSTAVRLPDGSIKVIRKNYVSARKKHKILNSPVIRGVVSFAESMKLSYAALSLSADAFMSGVPEEPSKFEKWLEKRFGEKLMNFIMSIAMVFGVALGLGLFLFLPNWIARGIENLSGLNLGAWKGAVSGVFKLAIFILYIYLVSLMKEIRRTFEYHGAEHKSIACYEAGDALTPENAKKHTRFHPRCGTSFMFVMILFGIIISIITRLVFQNFISFDKGIYEALFYTGIGIILLPLICGIGFEFLMYAGKRSEKPLIMALCKPGMWMQRITTREPDLQQLEVAITALKAAMLDEFGEEKADAASCASEQEQKTEADEEAEHFKGDTQA